MGRCLSRACAVPLAILLSIASVHGQQARAVPAGMLLLEAERAVIVTTGTAPVKLGPHDAKGFAVLGYWISSADAATWKADIPRTGRYRLLVESGNEPGTGTNLVRLGSEGLNKERGIEWTPAATEAWDDIQVFAPVGSLSLEAGPQVLRLEVVTRKAYAVMNLRSLVLVPETIALETARDWLAERSRARLLAWGKYQDATKQRSAGNTKEALARSQEAVGADPAWGEAWHALAKDLDTAGKTSEARSAYVTATGLKAGDPWVMADAAGLEARLGHYPEALGKARQALERFEARALPVPAWFVYNCGVWAGGYQNPADPEAALFFFRYVIEKAQADVGLQDAARYQLAQMQRLRKDLPAYESARDWYLREGRSAGLKGALAQAEADSLEASEAAFATFAPWYQLSVDYFRLQASELAAEPKPDGGAVAEARWKASSSLRNLLRREEAWLEAELAVKAAPTATNYANYAADRLLDLVYVRFAGGDFAASIELCARGLALTPKENEGKRIMFELLGSLANAELGRAPRKPEAVHKVMVFVIPESAFEGRSGGAEQAYIDELATGEALLARFWEAVSGGEFSVSFDHRILKGARATGLSPGGGSGSRNIDLNGIGIDQVALEKGLAGSYDTFMYYWNPLHVPSIASGGGGRGRGIVTVPLSYVRGDANGIMLHEFWHVLQNLIDLGPSHVWLLENQAAGRAWLPSWTGSTEASWIREVIERRLPLSLAKAAARKNTIGWKTLRFIQE